MCHKRFIHFTTSATEDWHFTSCATKDWHFHNICHKRLACTSTTWCHKNWHALLQRVPSNPRLVYIPHAHHMSINHITASYLNHFGIKLGVTMTTLNMNPSVICICMMKRAPLMLLMPTWLIGCCQ